MARKASAKTAMRHASTQAYIDYMRPRCDELARVLKKTGTFYYHRDWHANQTRISLRCPLRYLHGI